MRKLKIYLIKVEKINNKIQNVLSFDVKNDKQIADLISFHKENLKKFELSNFTK
jgi:hypothetical protein